MTTPKCVCILNRKRACEACILLAEKESTYESNVDCEPSGWLAHFDLDCNGATADDFKGNSTDLPDYF